MPPAGEQTAAIDLREQAKPLKLQPLDRAVQRLEIVVDPVIGPLRQILGRQRLGERRRPVHAQGPTSIGRDPREVPAMSL